MIRRQTPAAIEGPLLESSRTLTYQAWVRHGAVWTSLGTALPDSDGSARLIAETPALATLPDAVEVTLEPRMGNATPSGPVVVAWVP